MLVVVPSRGRPQNIAELTKSWEDTQARATLLIALDDDDPRLDDYLVIKNVMHWDQVQWTVGPRLRLAGTLNAVVMSRIMRTGTMPHDIIGFMGDDHRPRTLHWDMDIENVVSHYGSSIVYGNDLLQGQNLPTQVFITADIIKTLGYFCPPGLVHMYLDNAWKTWGEAMGRLYYLVNTVIEHMHPVAGKAPWDDRYIEVNAGSQYADDQAAFKTYVASRLHDDAEKLRSLISG